MEKIEAKAQNLYGQLGILAYDPVEDKVQCHICGKWFRGLNNHILRTHGWTVDEYREEFGLNRNQSLICQGTRSLLRGINLKLGNWRHLSSQTMTKEELGYFLKSIGLPPGYLLRTQARLSQAQRFSTFNPLNQPDVKERALARERQTWYGTERMRGICRTNILGTIVKLREKNIEDGRWSCPCDQVFPTRKEAEHHRGGCPVARQQKREKGVEARRRWWNKLTPEERNQRMQPIFEARRRHRFGKD